MIRYSTPGIGDSRGAPVACAVNVLAVLGLQILSWAVLDWGPPVYAGGEENKDETAANASRVSATLTEHVRQWTRELDDDHYTVREAAQQRLVVAGNQALKPVAAVAMDRDASLESVTRAVRILTTWSESKDTELRLAALEKLAALTNRPLEAALATEVLATLREQKAIETIQRLGGLCEPVNRLPANARIPRQYKNRQPLRVTLGANWNGTDDDLQIIAKIRRTSIVSLHSAPVGERALLYLPKITALTRVEIYGMQLSTESIDALRKQLPETVTIEVRRSGAKLGIGGDLALGGAHVTTVLPGSAADRGGLQPHDIITHVGGEPVDSFEALTKRIAAYQPGETVQLTIRRKNNTITKKVTFDRWGASKKTAPAPGAIGPN